MPTIPFQYTYYLYWLQFFINYIFRMPYPVCRITDAVSRIPYSVHRIPYTVSRASYSVRRIPYAVFRTTYGIRRTGYVRIGNNIDNMCIGKVLLA